MITTRQTATDTQHSLETAGSHIIALTYRYVGSYAIYLGVKLNIFSVQHVCWTAQSLQQALFLQQGRQFKPELLERVLNTLCAYGLLTRNSLHEYALSSLGRELCSEHVQQGILHEFSDERWTRISQLSALAVTSSAEAFDDLFINENYSAQLSMPLKELIKGYQAVKMLQFAGDLNLLQLDTEREYTEPEKFIMDYLVKLEVSHAIVFQAFILHEIKEKWLALPQLYHTMQSGEDAFAQANGMPLFDYLAHHPALNQVFNAAMSSVSTAIEIPAIVERARFAGEVMDMGGGEGRLLAAILDRYPDVSGINFDLPQVVRNVVPSHPRCRLAAGSFFNLDDIPAADTIILKRVLHDWSDDKAVSILQNCQARLRPGGRVVIIEYLADSELMAKADLMMMAIGGKARTAQDFQRLAARAGMVCCRVAAVTPMMAMVELGGLSLQSNLTFFESDILQGVVTINSSDCLRYHCK